MTNPPNLVHEAEAQRQHIRIPLPAQVTVAGITIPAADWSNGGVGLQLPESVAFPLQFQHGNKLDATIYFPFEGFGMSLPVMLEITYADAAKGRVGCKFEGMNRQQQSVIQYFVSAYISGEIIRVNDIMDVVARNNFTKSRAVPDPYAGLSPAEISKRKMAQKLRVFTLVGIAALLVTYIAMSIYERAFIVSAASGRVTAEMLTVDAPAGGKIYFNPIDPDSKVTQGQPLLTVSTAQGNSFSVDSPCDCIVKRRLSDNNRLIRKGEPALELVRPDATPYVEAYIPQREAVKLTVGEDVLLSMPGKEKNLRGTIKAIQAGKGLKGNSLVRIATAEKLSAEMVDDPVEVRVDTLHLF